MTTVCKPDLHAAAGGAPIDAQALLSQSHRLETLGRVAGSVAHDFNNLLTAIAGFAELALQNLRHGDPAARDVCEIRRAASRAAALTRQILTFARWRPCARRAIDLNAVVEGLEGLLRRLIREDIDLRLLLAPSLDPVGADPAQVEQVVMNLCLNARDAMPEGGRLAIETSNVTIDAEHAARLDGLRPGRHARLVVTDTGTGMTEEVRARAFEPFFTTKEECKGTGLGLATVREIIRECGGHISVESEPGRGTTFTILLPRAGEPAAPCEPRAPPPPVAPRGAEAVLVVEDDETVRNLTARILRAHGYEVLTAPDGAEAIAVAGRRDGPIHALVTDVVLPQLGGPELARRLVAARPGLRVLYVSGYAASAPLVAHAAATGTSVLTKPFSPDSLVRRLREVLDGPRCAEEDRSFEAGLPEESLTDAPEAVPSQNALP